MQDLDVQFVVKLPREQIYKSDSPFNVGAQRLVLIS
jgi:hypothetical protein